MISEAGDGNAEEKPAKQVELEALLAAPEGFGDDVPIDPNSHSRRGPIRTFANRREGKSWSLARQGPRQTIGPPPAPPVDAGGGYEAAEGTHSNQSAIQKTCHEIRHFGFYRSQTLCAQRKDEIFKPCCGLNTNGHSLQTREEAAIG